MKVIGLTGPIGSGKNEVARILRRHGSLIIDADKAAHTLYSTQSTVSRKLIKTFGTVNRKKLGGIVFSDRSELIKLNKIIHPYLKSAIVKKVESSKSSVVSCKLIVINAAVLKEIGLVDHVDEVWVVLASREKREKRLIKKGLSKQEAQKRINSQASQKEYLEIADVVIRNDGTLKQLNAKVQDRLKV